MRRKRYDFNYSKSVFKYIKSIEKKVKDKKYSVEQAKKIKSILKKHDLEELKSMKVIIENEFDYKNKDNKSGSQMFGVYITLLVTFLLSMFTLVVTSSMNLLNSHIDRVLKREVETTNITNQELADKSNEIIGLSLDGIIELAESISNYTIPGLAGAFIIYLFLNDKNLKKCKKYNYFKLLLEDIIDEKQRFSNRKIKAKRFIDPKRKQSYIFIYSQNRNLS